MPADEGRVPEPPLVESKQMHRGEVARPPAAIGEGATPAGARIVTPVRVRPARDTGEHAAQSRRREPEVPDSPAAEPSLELRREGRAAERPTIRVTIGRVDVRAVMPSGERVSREKVERKPSTLSLDAYLEERNAGRR